MTTKQNTLRAKMEHAQQLIKEKRYDEARTILRTVNHNLAFEWRDKLDKIDPPKSKMAPLSPQISKIWIPANKIDVVKAEVILPKPKSKKGQLDKILNVVKHEKFITRLDRLKEVQTTPARKNSTAFGAFIYLFILILLLAVFLVFICPSLSGGTLLGGTFCTDGWISGSSGSGTCSHHGGIAGGSHHRK
jgi:hypothetical protein